MTQNKVSVPAKKIPTAPTYGTGPSTGATSGPAGTKMTAASDKSTLAAANSKAAPSTGNAAPKGFSSGLINGKI